MRKRKTDTGTRAIVEHSFANNFDSEARLQEAIASLMQRIPGHTDVQILQGTQEFGKDIIFRCPAGMGDTMLCACVVKNTKITGNVASSGGARTVFNQAAQCLDTPHVDTAGREVPVERVYVVTPYEISPPTISSIRGALAARSGQIVFLSGPQLFDLFKRYWPDFFADEAEAILSHIRRVKDALEGLNPVIRVLANYSIGTKPARSQWVYIPQKFYRELHTFSVAEEVTAWAEKLEDVRRELSASQVRAISDSFGVAGVFVAALEGVIPEGHGAVAQKLAHLAQELTFSWKTTVIRAEKRKKGQKGSDDVPVDLEADGPRYEAAMERATARIDGLSEFLAAAQSVKAVLWPRVSSARKTLGALTALRSKRLTGSAELLQDERFQALAKFHDAAIAAPLAPFRIVDRFGIEFPKDFLDGWNGPLLVVGAPGYGKTSFCKWNALEDSERYMSGVSRIIPQYIPLHHLAQERLGTFEETFLATLGRSALMPAAGAEVAAGRRMRLYLDGLDEVALPGLRSELMELARVGSLQYPWCQVVVTARNHLFGAYLDWLPRLSLAGFEEADVRSLVSRWLGDDEKTQQFYEQLAGLPSLRSLMKTPLLATLILIVFQQTGRLPESLSRLYTIFVELLTGGWDTVRQVTRGAKFGQVPKVRFLQRLAASLHERKRREFDDRDIRATLGLVFSSSFAGDVGDIRHELLEDGLVTATGDALHFAHLSFQEFLTAKFYANDVYPRNINQALEAYLLGDEWWEEVLKFYIGLAADSSHIAGWLASKSTEIASMGRAQVADRRAARLFKALCDAYPDSRARDELYAMKIRGAWLPSS